MLRIIVTVAGKLTIRGNPTFHTVRFDIKAHALLQSTVTDSQ